MIFIVRPKAYNSKIEKAMVTGIVNNTTRLALHERRKMIITKMASSNPS
jgi:hypothetical protein